MDINAMLKGVHCSCGRHHVCDIKFVSIKKGAICALTDITKAYRSILLVADENTYGVAGEKTVEALAGKQIRKVIFSGETVLIPDEKAIARVTENLEGVDLIIGIGSGVIQDLCKYVSHMSKIPYYVVATAPSMDGYASTGAAIDALFKAQHTDELVKDGKVHLRVDYKVSGIGSHSCGPALSNRHRLEEKEIDFAFTMKPIR